MPDIATLGLRLEGDKATTQAQQFAVAMDVVGVKSEAAAAKVATAGRTMTTSTSAYVEVQQRQLSQLDRWNAIADANAAKQQAMRAATTAQAVATTELAVAEEAATVAAVGLQTALSPMLIATAAIGSAVTFLVSAWEKHTAAAERAAKAIGDAVERMREAARLSRLGIGGQFVDDEHSGISRMLTLRAEIARLEASASANPASTDAQLNRQDKEVKMLADKRRELAEIVTLIGNQRKGVEDLVQAERNSAFSQHQAVKATVADRDEQAAKQAAKQADKDATELSKRKYAYAQAEFAAAMKFLSQETAARNAAADEVAEHDRVVARATHDEIRKTVDAREAGAQQLMDSATRAAASAFGATGAIGKFVADGLRAVFADTSIYAGMKTALYDVLVWLKDSLGGAFSAIKGSITGGGLGTVGVVLAGVGLVAAALGAFEDSADGARRAAVAMAEAQNAYAVTMKATVRELSGGGSTVQDQIERYRKTITQSLAANAAVHGERNWMGLPTGTLTPAGMTEQRRLLALLAEAEARVTAEYRAGLTVRTLAAQGHQDEANALQFTLQQQKEYRDLRASGAAADLIAQLAVTQAAERAAYVTAKYAGTLSSLGSLAGSLKLSSLSTLSPGQQLAEAQRQYQDLLLKAQGGDQGAAGQLSGAANAYLTASRGFNASGTAYAADFARVQSDTSALIDSFKARQTAEAAALEAANASNDIARDGFTGIITGITGTNNRIDKLIAAMRQSSDAAGVALL